MNKTPEKPKGRPPICKTSTRKRLIKRATIDAAHRRLPFESIAELEGVHVHRQTLTALFAKAGYHRRKGRRKPLLTEKHKKDRLEFARQYINWTVNDWRRVLWTDEASIKVGWFGQIYVTRKACEELLEDCLAPRFRNYSALMIWGAISLEHCFDCHFFDDGGINGNRYRNEILPLLNEIRLKFIIDNDGEEPIFMQDNASIHKAYATMALLNQMGLTHIDWPANSPDLNPIENIWSILKQNVAKHKPTTRAQVQAAVEIEWAAMDKQVIFDCVKSMPERLQAVIDAEGGHTRW